MTNGTVGVTSGELSPMAESEKNLLRIVVAILTAAILGLASWIYNTGREIVRLQDDTEHASIHIDELIDGTQNRYTSDDGRRDLNEARAG